ncbi:MAG TPA: hypothetical protein VKV02_04575, partial [Acidobacteriaceae bacterium]|nr:hypothetical protein [Acidobacteriaceae bacterium]
MSKRLVAVGAVLVLLLGVFLSMGLSPGSGTALAADNSPAGTGAQWIFFPWVPNGEKIGDTGPWYGSVIIQNIEDSPVTLNFGKTAGGVDLTMTATVQPHASYIYSASALGLPDGGGGVAVVATWSTSQPPSGICEPQNGGPISVTRYKAVENLPAGTTKTADVDVVAGLPVGATITQVGTAGQYTKGTDYTVSGNQITWISTNRPNPGDVYPVTYSTLVCSRAPEISGLEKQASPASSGFGDQTSSSNTIVDGYAAVPMQDVAWGPSSAYCQAIQSQLDGTCNDLGAYFLGLPATFWGGSDAQIHFDGHSYLPIVQSNWNSWDSYIHITNVDASTPNGGSQVTVQFFSAGQGVGNTAVASYQTNVAQGATVTVDVAQALKSSGYDKDSFVGSAWITSDYGVVTSE